jgi:hypothetical protein
MFKEIKAKPSRKDWQRISVIEGQQEIQSQDKGLSKKPGGSFQRLL